MPECMPQDHPMRMHMLGDHKEKVLKRWKEQSGVFYIIHNLGICARSCDLQE